MRVVVINHLSLDGVMQAPGRPDEDTRGGFAHGGWASIASDPAMAAAMSAVMGDGFSWLFGRRSYEDMLQTWNAAGGPFKDGLNGPMKFVASSDPMLTLEWPNSTLLIGDVPGAVAELRERPGGNLVIMGSGQLIRSLLPHDLIDDVLLMIHPLVLGSGQRLFGQDASTHQFRLERSETTAGGVILATYAAARVLASSRS